MESEANGGLDLLLHSLGVGETLRHSGGDRLGGAAFGIAPGGLVGDGKRLGQLVAAHLGHGCGNVVAVVRRQLVVHRGLHSGGGDEASLQGDRLGHPLLGGLEALGQDGFAHLRGARLVVTPAARGAGGLDHHHRHVAVGTDATGHHHLERGLVAVGVGGMRDPLAVGGVGDPYGADRATERDARDSQRGRGGVERQNVVGVLLVGAQHEAHDVDLIAEPVREGGPQRAVDQPAGQGGLLAGPALPAEEGAGDLAGGEHPLLDVDGQRKEVGSLPCARRRRGGH